MQTARSIVFKITPAIKQEMVKIIDARIREAHVTKEDFSELKSIVKDLAVAQKRTEIKVEELAEAQKRSEVKVEELAVAQKELVEAQKRTELAITRLSGNIDALTQEVSKLSVQAKVVDTKLGGVNKSIGFAFENEAYRHLPGILKSKYGIDIKEEIIRTRIGGREIDLLGHAIRDGREVLVVGEAKTKLDERKDGKIDRTRLRILPGRPAAPAEFFKPLFDLPYEQARENLLAQFQRDYFQELLARHGGNMARIADAAGVNRSTVYCILEN